jgi:regulator of cell morphogenesis and NO signaling
MHLTEGQTVADIASQSLAAVRVFEKYGIDYCCGGKRPLAEVCASQGVPLPNIIADLTSATAQAAASGADWNQAGLRELIEHIVSTHHEYLKTNLPLLDQRIRKVASVHGAKDERLTQLPEIFAALKSELDQHLQKEEIILFPMISRFESAVQSGAPIAPSHCGSVANPIRVMEAEHDSAGEALRQLRELTSDYAIPDYACVTYRSMLSGLREMEDDLHMHIHLENNILFPRAIQMEAQAGARC